MSKDIILSVNPPYSRQILNGFKTFEFRQTQPKKLKKNQRVFIYETKNYGGCGNVIGYATLTGIYNLLYNKSSDDLKTIKERHDFIKLLYIDWCMKTGVQPLKNEGYFRDKRFLKYQEEIGFSSLNFNYAWEFIDFIAYSSPKEIEQFGLTRPPQSWCYIKQVCKERERK